jgi:hypothetical protein
VRFISFSGKSVWGRGGSVGQSHDPFSPDLSHLTQGLKAAASSDLSPTYCYISRFRGKERSNSPSIRKKRTCDIGVCRRDSVGSAIESPLKYSSW